MDTIYCKIHQNYNLGDIILHEDEINDKIRESYVALPIYFNEDSTTPPAIVKLRVSNSKKRCKCKKTK